MEASGIRLNMEIIKIIWKKIRLLSIYENMQKPEFKGERDRNR